MKKAFVLAASLTVSLAMCFAADRGPSTPEERDRALKAAELLQTDPLSPAANREREWGVMWLIQIPDISVPVCTHPKAPKKYKFSGELMAANMLSMAAFAIQNPDQARDNKALWRAGTEGMLKSYAAILKTAPKAQNDFYDDLLAKQQAGALGTYVSELAANCKQ